MPLEVLSWLAIVDMPIGLLGFLIGLHLGGPVSAGIVVFAQPQLDGLRLVPRPARAWIEALRGHDTAFSRDLCGAVVLALAAAWLAALSVFGPPPLPPGRGPWLVAVFLTLAVSAGPYRRLHSFASALAVAVGLEARRRPASALALGAAGFAAGAAAIFGPGYALSRGAGFAEYLAAAPEPWTVVGIFLLGLAAWLAGWVDVFARFEAFCRARAERLWEEDT